MTFAIYSARFGRLRKTYDNDGLQTADAWKAAGYAPGAGEAAVFVPARDDGYTFDELQALITQQTGLDPVVLNDWHVTVIDGVVTNCGACDPACGDFPDAGGALINADPGVVTGYLYDGATFTPPPPTDEDAANMRRKGSL